MLNSNRESQGQTSPESKPVADFFRFWRTWFTAPLRTGAQAPSGRALAREMAASVDLSVPGPIVELGPGTGPVTAALLERGIAPERLFLVELSPDFCSLLRRRFPRVSVNRLDAFEVPKLFGPQGKGTISHVVSSLPLLTQPVERRIELLDAFFKVMHPAGKFIQFTYARKSPIPVNGTVLSEHGARIWKNVWPAVVWRYRQDRAARSAAAE